MRLSLTICRSASRSEHQKDDHDQYGHRLQYHAIDHQLVLALAADILAGRHQHDPAHQYEKCGKRPERDQNEEEAIHARSEEHTSELQSLMRISYAVFCLKKKITTITQTTSKHIKCSRKKITNTLTRNRSRITTHQNQNR